MSHRNFSLAKGDRFSLDKEDGLSSLTVTLGWKGAADLDACAFLLGEDGSIMNDADFVYYNSNNREKPFTREEFSTKRRWRELTRPMSADGSVLGSIDDLGDDNGDSSEDMKVNLEKVNCNISEIVFCTTIYDEKNTFGHVNDPYISIVNDETGEEICRYDLKEKFQSETAVVVGRLLYNENGNWEFEAVGQGYIGGMQMLIDIYA